MRKGYGPTGVSFPYFFGKFKTEVAKGPINVALCEGAEIVLVDLSKASETQLESVYNKMDRVMYTGGKFVHVLV